MVEVKVEGVHKSYGKQQVLDNVSFSVANGEFVVLLGPSGCGKTTLLRCVAGLEKVDKGDVFLGPERANDLLPRDRDLAMVFQGFSLFPIMSVRENIAFPLKVRGVSQQASDARVVEVAKILGIEGILDKSPKAISGGEQQRVAIGRAIAREPKAFLMDEPLSSLDAPLRAQLRSELKRIQKEIGVTTLYVTHDQAEALALADKIGVINKGTLLQFGSPQTVFQTPSSAFVARFVGDPQANIVNVSLRSSGGAYSLQGEAFSVPISLETGKALEAKAKAGDEPQIQISIRPEDIEIATTSAGSLGGTVFLDEPLTLYRVITVHLGDAGIDKGLRMKVLVGRDVKLDVGKPVWLKFNPAKFHYFDRESGNLIL